MNDGNSLGYEKLDMALERTIEHAELVDVAVFPFSVSNPVCPTQQLTAHTHGVLIQIQRKQVRMCQIECTGTTGARHVGHQLHGQCPTTPMQNKRLIVH